MGCATAPHRTIFLAIAPLLPASPHPCNGAGSVALPRAGAKGRGGRAALRSAGRQGKLARVGVVRRAARARDCRGGEPWLRMRRENC